MAAKDNDPTLPAGALLGHWRIEKLLGEGGMGRVYLAEHNAIGRKVALKVLKRSLARSPELVERFFAEAHAVNRIRHPGIVEVTDCFIADDGTPCIVMELLLGRTVTEEMAVSRIHPARVAQIGAEVALALDAAHKAGVIHRDLKPDNVFLVDAERAGDLATVKVLDFGVAKLMDPMPNSTVHTVAGSIMGTPDYMAPEQLAGKPVDARADIYSLGASLYHACTGRVPFAATNFGDLVVMHMTKPPTPPTCFANLPPVLEQVLLAMLEKDPARRPQTMGDVALLLRSAQKLGSVAGSASVSASLAVDVARATLAPQLAAPIARERTELCLAPVGLISAANDDDRGLPVVDGEVSGPVVLGQLLAQARSLDASIRDGAMPGPHGPHGSLGIVGLVGPVGPPPALPPPRGVTPSQSLLAALPMTPALRASRAPIADDASGSFPPSGTLLLGSAEAPEVADDEITPSPPRPPSSWFAGHLAPPGAPAHGAPMWAWAALGAVLCFAALGAVWSVGQDVELRARAAAATASINGANNGANIVDPYAPLGGLAVLDAHADGNGDAPAAVRPDGDEGDVRSDAPVLTSTADLDLEPRMAEDEPVVKARVAKHKKKPVRRPVARAQSSSTERRRAVLDPFAAERD
jgi:tRNA A-37 threonylcarbamoyl transferase component Bud32